MSSEVIVNLDNFRTAAGAKIFSGRDRGEEVRRRIGLDSRESNPDVTVSVVIPEDTFTLNLSFFLGLFSASVRSHGRTWFDSHYTFTGPQTQLDKLGYYKSQAEIDAVPLPQY